MTLWPFPYLDAAAIARDLPMPAAIAAMRAAFADDVDNPPRVLLENSLFMPARVGGYTGIKVVCIKPGNPVGTVTLYDPDGTPVGMLDGAALTTLRTGAASGLATDLLAQKNATRLAMLGTGAVSARQIEAVLCVRNIRQLSLWSRNGTRAAPMAAAIHRRHPQVQVRVMDSADDAVAQADIVCCATPAKQPLFAPDAVQPGTHINAVGAFTPDMAEVPAEVLRDACVIVESREAAAREAGDLLQAKRRPDAMICDLLAQRHPGRVHAEQVTVFKSVGIASQDVAAAMAAVLGPEIFESAPTKARRFVAS